MTHGSGENADPPTLGHLGDPAAHWTVLPRRKWGPEQGKLLTQVTGSGRPAQSSSPNSPQSFLRVSRAFLPVGSF